MPYLFSCEFLFVPRSPRDGYFNSVSLFLFCRPLQNRTQALRAFGDRVCHLILLRNQLQKPLQPLFKKGKLHVFVATPQKKINLNPMAFCEPLGCPFGLEVEVVLAGPDFDLDRLGFCNVRFGLNTFPFLLLFVVEFTIFHDFCNWRHGIWRYFYQIETGFLRPVKRFGKGEHPKVLPLGAYDAHLLRADLMVNTSSIQGRREEYNKLSKKTKGKENAPADAAGAPDL